MNILRIIPFMMALTLLASCTPSESHYKAIRASLNNGYAEKHYMIEGCASRGMSSKTRKELAAALRVPESRVNIVICTRLANGIASGRLTYSDMQSFYEAKKATPNMIRVLQGG
ncbi:MULTISPECIES: hypothetical protein [unclassified Sinorhizobium]|uniref:hypothetical protein n=1 Tax=unclassified Sinorhizobium TaxID=2613772 RepID=UPI003523D63C